MRLSRRRTRHSLIITTLALTLSVAGGTTTASAAPTAGIDDEVQYFLIPDGQVVDPIVSSVTLVTGDTVQLERAANGHLAATIDPAPRGDREPSFETFTHDGDTYIIPSDAAILIPDVLDRELFNITKLAEYGYTDGVPVIVTRSGFGLQATGSDGMSVTATLPSIGGIAATITADGAWWSTVRGADGDGDLLAAAANQFADIERVWLDDLAEVTLDESVPLVGAPEAWAAGYDGTGVTVAVLDTGIDANHPDLTGKVVAAQNFTGDEDASDEHGHGTHVASTVAGTGAAAGGTYTGVAPGAQLINAKVCNSFGTCPTSAMIAGMEWAATQGADVANLSIGGAPTDGTDPLSQAVNQLTAQHDMLFVIAAGNRGAFGDQTVTTPGAADAALTVGAVDKSEQLAGFSGRGPRVGDFAIKPDITAPGVDIVAARAAGTSLGPPVGDHYTQASGTSMATPHVAGAAAILLQRDPQLGADELKAALATAATPHDDLDVYQQGGGRLDVPAALNAPVRATPSPLNLGYFQYPHDDAAPVHADVSYTNRTNEPVMLDLALDVASRDGDVPSTEMLSVEPAAVTVEPGSSVEVTVTVDVGVGEFGLYGGYLVAESGGSVVSRVPVGFYKESEMYTLTVEGIARDGRAAAGISSFHILEVHDTTRFLETSNRFTDGVATLRVPPGTYHVMGVVYTYDGTINFTQERVLVGHPEVVVTEDTTVVLDARAATPLVIDTIAHEETAPFGTSRVAFYRRAEDVGSLSASWTGAWQPTFAVPTEPVTLGAFEFNTRTRIGLPPLALSIVDPIEQELNPRPMLGTPPLDDDVRLPVAWVGAGEPADYEGLDVQGAAVLSQRGLGPSHAEKEATARAHGAAALILMNNTSGNYSGFVGNAAEIPSMTISMEEGDLLRDLMSDGEVVLRMRGVSATPFLYDLVFAEPDRIPDELHYVADPTQLAALDNRFHNDIADHQMNEVRHFWRPFDVVSIGVTTALPVPQGRTEYLVGGDTRYRQNLWADPPFTGSLSEPITFYTNGERREQTWFKQVNRPGVLDGGPFQASQPTLRDGDDLVVRVQEWVDADGHYGARHTAVDTTAFRLYENGELIAEGARAQGSFAVSPEPAEHRLELDVSRDAPWWTTSTETRTAWTLQSVPPAGDEPAVVPLLEVDYETDLNLLNTAPHPRDRSGPAAVDLTVRHQPGADGPAIAGARLWVSYDDGATWQERPARDLGSGRFRFVLDSRDPVETNGFVALRVDAWDVGGNRIEQEIIRAWQLTVR